MALSGSPILDQYNQDGIVTPPFKRALDLYHEKAAKLLTPLAAPAETPQGPKPFVNYQPAESAGPRPLAAPTQSAPSLTIRQVSAPVKPLVTPAPPDPTKVTVMTGDQLSYPGPRQLGPGKPLQAQPATSATAGPKPLANPIPEAYRGPSSGLQIPEEAGNRSALAKAMARKIHDAGFGSEHIPSDPADESLFWNNLAQGLSKQKHYNPSSLTIENAKHALVDLEKTSPSALGGVPAHLAKNPRALAAARALQEELGK